MLGVMSFGASTWSVKKKCSFDEAKVFRMKSLEKYIALHTRDDYRKFLKDERFPLKDFGEYYLDRINWLAPKEINFKCEVAAYTDWFLIMAPLSEEYILLVNSISISKTFDTFLQFIKNNSVSFNYLEQKQRFSKGLPTIIDME